MDRETIAIEKIVCYSQLPRGGGMPHPDGGGGGWTQGSTGVGQQAEEEGGTWARPFIVVFKQRNWRGRVNRFRIG